MDERFSYMDDRFEFMEHQFEFMQDRFGYMENSFGSIKEQFAFIDARFDYIEENMVTKDYLETRLENLATKEDLAEMPNGLIMVLASKADLFALTERVARLEKRTDEDIRAVMADVARLKNVRSEYKYRFYRFI